MKLLYNIQRPVFLWFAQIKPKIILCFILLQIVIPFQIVKSQTIHLEGDVWAPYVMDPEQGEKGFMVEIAELVFKNAGYKIEFKVTPWTRALLDTEAGTTDGAVGIYVNQANEKKFIVPTEEIGISVNKLYIRKDYNWKYAGVKSLDTLILGVIADYDYGELNAYISANKKKKSKQVEFLSGNQALERNLRKLVANRISVLIEDEVVVDFFSRKMGLQEKIKAAGTVLPNNKVSIAFSPRNPKSVEYARILSEGIQKLRKTGELKTILDKYFVKDWK